LPSGAFAPYNCIEMALNTKFLQAALTLPVLALFLGARIPVHSQTFSTSKISAHLINAYTIGASNIIGGHPRILKILDLGSGMLQAARAYKTETPNGKIVLRLYTTTSYPITSDPAASATNFWTSVLQPPISALSASDQGLIDYLEGPNEGDSTPTWQSSQSVQWFTTFWTNLSPLIAAAGFKPCIGSIAVGNPPGTVAQIQSDISTFVPALRQAKSLGGAWSYHAYTINYDTDTGTEYYYSLRYRQFYAQFASQYADLLDMPMILTEGGVDQSGTPSTSGWQARGTAADYERWLNWFDRQLGLDGYILGCTIFEVGNPTGWSSFDLEPIGVWMGNYLATPTNMPSAPTGLSVLATNGTALLMWTSAPLNPTTYNVKRSQSSGGTYTMIANNVTEGVTATTYTDSAVTNGGTYFYVISASNALGEGPNSSQVTVTMPNLSLPDLIVTAVSWSPNPPFAGNNITFRATVKNQGTAPTPSGIVLGVGFSIDGGANVTWSGSYASALAPGASVTLTADGGPTGASTWKATAGPHTFTANANDIHRFPESNFNNNFMTVNLPIAYGRPNINSISQPTNGFINFNFNTTSGLLYSVQFRNDLTTNSPWQSFGPATTAISNVVWVADSVTNLERFYRAVLMY